MLRLRRKAKPVLIPLRVSCLGSAGKHHSSSGLRLTNRHRATRAKHSKAAFLLVLENCSHAPTASGRTMTPPQNTVVLEERKAPCSPAVPYYGRYAEGTAYATGKSHRLELPENTWSSRFQVCSTLKKRSLRQDPCDYRTSPKASPLRAGYKAHLGWYACSNRLPHVDDSHFRLHK